MRIVKERLERLGQQMTELEHSLKQETKSSAGDKYETGRAMLHMEQEKISKQVDEARMILTQLSQIDPSSTNDMIETGALVITDSLNLYVSVALGKLTIDETAVYAISPASPLAKAMAGSESGSSFAFNEKNHLIREIY